MLGGRYQVFYQGETLPPLSGGLWSSAVPLKLGHLEACRIDPLLGLS